MEESSTLVLRSIQSYVSGPSTTLFSRVSVIVDSTILYTWRLKGRRLRKDGKGKSLREVKRMQNWIWKDWENCSIRNQELYSECWFCQRIFIFAWLDVKLERLHVLRTSTRKGASRQFVKVIVVFHPRCSANLHRYNPRVGQQRAKSYRSFHESLSILSLSFSTRPLSFPSWLVSL